MSICCDEWSTTDTHRRILAALHDGTVDVGNDGMGAHNAMVNVGDDSVGVRDVVLDIGNNGVGIGNDDVCVQCKFSLKVDGWLWPFRSDKTHVKDKKDLVQVQPPGCNHILIALRVQKSRDGISFTLLDDLPLDLNHGATTESVVSQMFRTDHRGGQLTSSAA